MEHIGRAIRLYRRSKGMKQRELSKIIGISQNSISQLERGATQPHYSTLKKICGALNITESQLTTSRLTNEELLDEVARRIDKD